MEFRECYHPPLRRHGEHDKCVAIQKNKNLCKINKLWNITLDGRALIVLAMTAVSVEFAL